MRLIIILTSDAWLVLYILIPMTLKLTVDVDTLATEFSAVHLYEELSPTLASMIVKLPSLLFSDTEMRTSATSTDTSIPRVQEKVGGGNPVAVQGKTVVSPTNNRVSSRVLPCVKDGGWAEGDMKERESDKDRP